ncbi:hypothetical protein PanWU01x14_089800 [Parasponia andersonii]|uniref:Uncharacterized protein n=1 Tax=Parasponia andersonii TaxID=3476 RepID=A0A2P5D7I6_PARAD|nr:hypothetical protein PanWU01x14_089800 [Parasponia andersonii]
MADDSIRVEAFGGGFELFVCEFLWHFDDFGSERRVRRFLDLLRLFGVDPDESPGEQGQDKSTSRHYSGDGSRTLFTELVMARRRLSILLCSTTTTRL